MGMELILGTIKFNLFRNFSIPLRTVIGVPVTEENRHKQS
jgi:hypothetical protein